MEETATKLSAEAQEGYEDKFALWGPAAADLDQGMCCWRIRTYIVHVSKNIVMPKCKKIF